MRSYNTSARFAQNPYYVEYENLLINLSFAMAEGKEAEADRIREEMDRSARGLNNDEIRRLNGLSADLYMLTDEEIFESSPYTPQKLAVELSSAWQQQDMERMLDLLRMGPPRLSMDKIAYLRSRAYGEMGHLRPAILFMRHAAQRHTANQEYKFLLLELLFRSGNIEQTVDQVQHYILENSDVPELMLQSATILLLSTKGLPRALAKPRLEEAAQLRCSADKALLLSRSTCPSMTKRRAKYDDGGRKRGAILTAAELEPSTNEAHLLCFHHPRMPPCRICPGR